MARSPGGSGGRNPRDRDRGRGRDGDEDNELKDKLVTINRVAKVVKGGRRFAFAAIVVVGDQRGRVGHGAGKAREVPVAISKAMAQARKNLVNVSLKNDTLHYAVRGTHGATRVLMQPASGGTGVIAGGSVRAVIENAIREHELLGDVTRDQLLYFPTVTREAFAHRGRLTDLLESGELAREVGLPPIDPSDDRFMICGSAAMLKDSAALLDRNGGRRTERVVGLVLDHRPHREPEGLQRLLEDAELAEDVGQFRLEG